jgi:hypothetical protein
MDLLVDLLVVLKVHGASGLLLPYRYFDMLTLILCLVICSSCFHSWSLLTTKVRLQQLRKVFVLIPGLLPVATLSSGGGEWPFSSASGNWGWNDINLTTSLDLNLFSLCVLRLQGVRFVRYYCVHFHLVSFQHWNIDNLMLLWLLLIIFITQGTTPTLRME